MEWNYDWNVISERSEEIIDQREIVEGIMEWNEGGGNFFSDLTIHSI